MQTHGDRSIEMNSFAFETVLSKKTGTNLPEPPRHRKV